MSTPCSYHNIEKIESHIIKREDFTPKQLAAVELALLSARNSTARYKVGCTLVSSSRLYRGESSHKTHPLQFKYNTDNINKIHLHAEISALAKVKNPKERLHLAVVMRAIKAGYADSAPCDSCLAALGAFKVENLLYYKDSNFFLVKLM